MKDRGVKLRTIIACLAVTLFVSGCGRTGGPGEQNAARNAPYGGRRRQ